MTWLKNNSRIELRILFALLLVGVGSNLFSQKSVAVSPEITSFKPSNLIEVEKSSLDLDEARVRLNGRSLDVEKYDTTKFDPSKDYWVKFTLENPSNKDGQWIIDFQGWSYVDFYSSTDNATNELQKTGHHVDYNDRSYPDGNKSYILLDLDSKSIAECYVRLNAAKNNSIMPNGASISAMPRHIADKKQLIFRSIVLALLAIYCIFFIYNGFIFLSTRDSSYLFYLGLVVLGFFLTMNYSGYFYEFFSFLEGTYRYQLAIENFIYNGFSICLIFFMHRLFQVKERYPKWYKASFYLIAMMIINTIAIYIDFETGMSMSMPTFMFFTLSAITFAVINIRAKFPSATFYLIGFGIVFIAGIINIMAVQIGTIPKTIITVSLIIPMAQVIEMLFYSFALANKINVLQKQNERSNRQIIKVLQEKKEVQEKANRELESKVHKRTMEIEDQKMVIEKEKSRVDELLLNILPFDTAEELKSNGKSEPKFLKRVSIMFTDFESFSSITKELEPKDLVKELDTCFRAFDSISDKYEIEKIKTIGDSYMCASGISYGADNNEQKIIQAAHEIHDFINAWNDEKMSQGKSPWRIRIGIHTGDVAAGVVGKRKFAFDIWGPAVNLASRMEAACEPGRVNISAATHGFVKDIFNCIPRGKITAKNIGEVEMFFADPKNN